MVDDVSHKFSSQRKIKLKVVEPAAHRFVVLFLYNSNVSSLKASCPTLELYWPLSSWILCDLEVPSSSNVSPAPITDSRAQPYQHSWHSSWASLCSLVISRSTEQLWAGLCLFLRCFRGMQIADEQMMYGYAVGNLKARLEVVNVIVLT